MNSFLFVHMFYPIELVRSHSRPPHCTVETEYAAKLVAGLARLRLDDNMCDLELYSGECVEQGAALRAHR